MSRLGSFLFDNFIILCWLIISVEDLMHGKINLIKFYHEVIMQTERELQTTAINTIRFLAVDGVQKANSGHPGLPMGAAAMAYTIWTRHLKHNPVNPKMV